MDYIQFIRSQVNHQNIFLNFAGAAILDENGNLLLQKRSDRHTWGLLGGCMELGESAEETAIREVKEESGLNVEVERLIGIYTKYEDHYPNGDQAQTVAVLFLCKAIGGELTVDGKESLDLQYFPLHDLPEIVNKQHKDMIDDIVHKRFGVYR